MMMVTTTTTTTATSPSPSQSSSVILNHVDINELHHHETPCSAKKVIRMKAAAALAASVVKVLFLSLILVESIAIQVKVVSSFAIHVPVAPTSARNQICTHTRTRTSFRYTGSALNFVRSPDSEYSSANPNSNIACVTHHNWSTSLLSSTKGNGSTSKRPQVKTKKKKKQKKRHSKEELNDLIRNIGLTPVVVTSNKDKQQSELSPTKLLQSKHPPISIKTQLQYARNGHAAIRSTIPIPILKSIKKELIQHSKNQELDAWKQKVEVTTQSIQKAQSCTSIKECKKILQQQQHQHHNDDHNMDEEFKIPFLQHFNTWQYKNNNPTVYSLVTSSFMASMASILLDVPSVRLYQDSLFHKRYDDGPTPWHSDSRMAPFDTSNMITFWIPLDYIPSVEDGGTGLWFVDKSHADFALPFWNPVPKCDSPIDNNNDDTDTDDDTDDVNGNNNDIYGRLEERYGGDDAVNHYMPIEVGDFTVHAGWTLHCANGLMNNEEGLNDCIPNHAKQDRYALAVTYVDARAEIRDDVQRINHNNGGSNSDKSNDKNQDDYLGHNEDRQAFQKWINDVEPRQYFEHPLVPIVWPPSSSTL